MNTKVFTNFGKHIKGLRMEAGFSQELFAEKLGVHRTYISFIERGQRNPSLKMLFKISRALKMKLPDIFSFDT